MRRGVFGYSKLGWLSGCRSFVRAGADSQTCVTTRLGLSLNWEDLTAGTYGFNLVNLADSPLFFRQMLLASYFSLGRMKIIVWLLNELSDTVDTSLQAIWVVLELAGLLTMYACIFS